MAWQALVDAGKSLARKPGSGRPSLMGDEDAEMTAALYDIGESCNWTGTNQYYAIALTCEGFEVSTSTVQRKIRSAGWGRGTASSIPSLTYTDTNNRIVHCTYMRKIPEDWIVLHQDEKVFYATDWAGQRAPPGTKLIKMKKTTAYKTKIMVSSIVGAPNEKYEFDGRLTLDLISSLYVAAKKSKYHAKGDVYEKSDNAVVDANYFFTYITTNVAPKIRTKFAGAHTVLLQMDNASPHSGKGNDTLLEETINKKKGKNDPYIKIHFQPANSPDLNLNDLGVFHSLNSKYRVIRTRSKLKAAKRRVASMAHNDGIGTRLARAGKSARQIRNDVNAARAGEYVVAPPNTGGAVVATPSPVAAATLPAGCSAQHNNESDADMPCIHCKAAGNSPAADGNHNWVRCDANGGWWHESCVRLYRHAVPLPAKKSSSWICALCRLGSSAALEEDDDGEDAWFSVFDVEVPVRYGLDSTEALWSATRLAWKALPTSMLAKLALTMQKVYQRVLEADGRNDYAIRDDLVELRTEIDKE